MAGKSKIDPHMRGKKDARAIPKVSLDYMYMTKKPDDEQLRHPILVIKEKITGGMWALATLRKGAESSSSA